MVHKYIAQTIVYIKRVISTCGSHQSSQQPGNKVNEEGGHLINNRTFYLANHSFFTAAGLQPWAFISLLEYTPLPL
jgi:hypothetical protein